MSTLTLSFPSFVAYTKIKSSEINSNFTDITTWANGNITNSNINASAAIAYSKLNLLGSIVNADVATAAAIAYSKLNLSGSILNTDINSSAAIAYSKLNLTGSLLNADINSSAAIARSKLASGTASHVVINDGSGALSSEASLAITRGGTGQATANAGFAALSPMTTNGDIIYQSGGVPTRLAIGSNGTFLGVVSGAPAWTAGNSNIAIASKSSAYTLTASDGAILSDASGAAFTLTLPAAASNSGKVFHIKKTDSSTNAVTVDGNASETIDGSLTVAISIQYESISIASDGSNWYVL